MSIKEGNNANIKWIGVTSVLFGVLLLANHGNEILRQSVIRQGWLSNQQQIVGPMS